VTDGGSSGRSGGAGPAGRRRGSGGSRLRVEGCARLAASVGFNFDVYRVSLLTRHNGSNVTDDNSDKVHYPAR